MSLLSLYLLFLKIGCFTFGGGYAMIPLFQDELVNRHGLLTTAEFADISVGSGRSADGWEVDKGWNELIVRSEKGAALLDLAREKGVLEFKPLPDGAVEKLKRAAQGKRDTALK